MSISILIAALVSNLITKFIKPSKVGLHTAEDMEARKLAVRIMNAGFGLIALVVTYVLVGGEFDSSQVKSYLDIIISGVITFASSQGLYFVAKNK